MAPPTSLPKQDELIQASVAQPTTEPHNAATSGSSLTSTSTTPHKHVLEKPRFETLRYNTVLTVRAKHGNVFNRVIQDIKTWIAPKLPEDWNFDHIALGNAHLYENDDESIICKRLNHDNETLWALKLIQNDSSFAYRTWITRLGIVASHDTVTLRVQISYAPKSGFFGHQYPPHAQVPNIINLLQSDTKLDVRWNDIPINLSNYKLNILKAVDIPTHLTKYLAGDIDHPIIVIPYEDDMLVTAIAYNTIGIAETVIIESNADHSWSADVIDAIATAFPYTDNKSAYHPSPSHIIVCLPKAYGNPFYLQTTTDIDVLCDKIETGLTTAPQNQPAGSIVYDLTDIINIEQSTRAHALEDRLKTAHSTNNGATLTRTDTDEDSYALAEAFAKDAEEAQRQIDEGNAIIYQLKTQLADAQQRASKVIDIPREAITASLIKPPTTLTEILTLAHELWSDRLVIHDDAYKSAKDFDCDLDEAIQIIMACATDLWSICFEEHTPNLESAFYQRTTFELAAHESSMTRKQNKLMALRDHVINGELITCEMHIKSKISNAFRVYVWPDQAKQVIHIVHAGEHLETAGTRLYRKR